MEKAVVPPDIFAVFLISDEETVKVLWTGKKMEVNNPKVYDGEEGRFYESTRNSAA